VNVRKSTDFRGERERKLPEGGINIEPLKKLFLGKFLKNELDFSFISSFLV